MNSQEMEKYYSGGLKNSRRRVWCEGVEEHKQGCPGR